jgi:hypothetical protein
MTGALVGDRCGERLPNRQVLIEDHLADLDQQQIEDDHPDEDACRRRRDACAGVIAGVSRADGPSAPAPQAQRLGRRLQIERRPRVDDTPGIVPDSGHELREGERRARLGRFQREAP